MTVATILLTDPEQRASLASARALARAGYRVVTVGVSRGLAGVSRATSRHVYIDNPVGDDRAQYVSAIAKIVREHAVDVILPITDAASRVLLESRAQLGAVVAGPSIDAYERASDKQALLDLAAECQIATPRQDVLTTRDDFAAVEAGLKFPLVAKPSRSVVDVDGVAIRQGVHFTPNRAVLEKALSHIPAGGFPVLLQERITGPGVGVFLLRMNGKTLITFAHLRLREKPPSGGVSTYREAITPPPDLVEKCERLLDALHYNGAAMIEFKLDAARGTYVLMEINARLWGSLQLAIDAGANFPAILIAVALDQPLPPAAPMKPGVRTYWEFGELDHAIALIRRSREELNAPPDMQVGLRAALKVLFDRRLADRAEVFRFTDPAPFSAELIRWLRGK